MITMLDTVTPAALPKGDYAYAGYVGGHWADANEIKQRFPNHYFLSIAVNAGETAECCDCETGDLAPAQVVPWIQKMHAAGIWRPCVYANQDFLFNRGLFNALRRSLPRSLYRIWEAAWDGQRTIPNWADAHQYADHGPHGENVDMSVVRDDFFPHHVRHPKPPPRIWHKPVLAHVRFDTQNGTWEIKGADN